MQPSGLLVASRWYNIYSCRNLGSGSDGLEVQWGREKVQSQECVPGAAVLGVLQILTQHCYSREHYYLAALARAQEDFWPSVSCNMPSSGPCRRNTARCAAVSVLGVSLYWWRHTSRCKMVACDLCSMLFRSMPAAVAMCLELQPGACHCCSQRRKSDQHNIEWCSAVQWCHVACSLEAVRPCQHCE